MPAEPKPLAVGLNLVYLTEHSGGSATYARELIRGILAVEPETRITAFVSAAAPVSYLPDGLDLVRFPFEYGGPPWTMAASVAAQWGALPALARRRGLDVIHGPANIAPPRSLGVPTVVTLLDLIWLHRPTMGWRGTLGMKTLVPISVRAADRVTAISDATRRDAVASLGIDPGRIDVAHLGIRLDPTVAPAPADELRRELDLRDAPVVLCVAQKREHKNLAGLIRALALLPDSSVQLVLPGSPTPHEEELRALARELGMAERVRFPGWVSEAQLETLYGLASCFVLPSFDEGFGLPVLEAMRRDVPVACSDAASLPEVAGDAALTFSPHDPGAIAAATGRILDDPAVADDLRRRGRERCALFTWERTARETLATYRRAIASARS